MAWKIDRDYIGDSEVGRASVRDLNPNVPHYRFRLLDDDGNVYYGGVCDLQHDEDGDDWESSEYGAFCWALSYAGATDFQMKTADAIASKLSSADYCARYARDGWASIYG